MTAQWQEDWPRVGGGTYRKFSVFAVFILWLGVLSSNPSIGLPIDDLHLIVLKSSDPQLSKNGIRTNYCFMFHN